MMGRHTMAGRRATALRRRGGVTVVIAARDAAGTLDVQLRALAAQRFDGPWEVIVADNGSTDDTVAIARSFSGRVPGLKIVDASARRGAAAARNLGATAARHPLLLFCDADDAAEPDWVAGLAHALADADAVAGGRRYDALNAAPHGPMDWPAPLFRKPPLRHLAAASSHNLGIRAAVFRDVGGFDETLAAAEDVDLCWRLQLAGFTLAAAPAAVMQIRRRSGVVATWRQAISYARADAVLAARYEGVGRGAGSPAVGVEEAPAVEEATTGARLLARLRTRGLRLPDPVHLAHRAGRAYGMRTAPRTSATTDADIPAPYVSPAHATETTGPALAASVIIAAYNAATSLAEQLEALLPQISDDTEVLVCDNGSRDATSRVAGRYVGDGRLRVIDASDRRGPAAARNIGAAHARGRLLLFCDADDVVAPGWVAAMVAALSDADLVAGALDGRTLNTANRASVSWEVSADIRMPFWTRYGAGASSNLGIRAETFASVDGFDERLRTAEDVDLCWRVQLAGHVFSRDRSALVRSRQRDGRRAVFRQAYAYGAGSRALRAKYRAYVDDDRGKTFREPLPPSSTSRPATAEAVPRARTSRMARALRVFTAGGQANLAWRLGEQLGARFGRVDPLITPMPSSVPPRPGGASAPR